MAPFKPLSASRVAALIVVLGGLGAASVGGLGCAAALPLPTEAHVYSAQGTWPGTTVADLDRGRATYARRCNACHLLHAPDEVREDLWPELVKKMAPRAKLSGAEAQDILRYLVVLSRAR